jgi:hypothetical protein
VHARAFDLGQRHDGPFQLALDRPPVVYLFGEFGESEVAFIEQLETDPSGLGKARRRHSQPHLGHLIRRDPNGAVVDAVLDVVRFELCYDLAGILGRQVGVQRAKIPFVVPLRELP